MSKGRSKSYKGVSYDKKREKWMARVTFSGVRYALGRYNTYEEATEAYNTAWDIGGVRVKAWYHIPPEYRGSITDFVKGNSEFRKEENKLKKFKSVLDGLEEDAKEYIW